MIGKESTIDLIFITVLCEGHVLIEDIPGVAKSSCQGDLSIPGLHFQENSMYADLLPSDVGELSSSIRRARTLNFAPAYSGQHRARR